MSADDFQNKYASVMESMLKSAIAETTKLFETMVDELKAEISQIKKENEDLKTRCIQYETAKSQPVNETSEGPVPDQCDTAVQCDLGPCRTVLVEQCQPLRLAELQNQEQRYANARMDYSLQEHNYVSKDKKDFKMALPHVKQEESYSDCSLQYDVKEEEVESPVGSGQVVRNNAGSKEPSVSGPENKGPVIQECSSEEIKSSPKYEATEVALEPTSVRMDSSLKHAQNQSCNSQDSLVISLKDAFTSYFKEECEVAEKMAETATQEELMSDKHSDPQESNPDSVTSAHKQNEDIVQHAGVHCAEELLAEPLLVNKDVACEELKAAGAECEPCSDPNSTPRRKRGRPPKKRRQNKILSPSTEAPKHQESTNAPSVGEKGIESSPFVTEDISSSKPSGESSAEPMETLPITTPLVHNSPNTVLTKKKEEVGSPNSVESVGSSVSSDKQAPSESQQLSKELKEDATAASETQSTPPADSLQTASFPLKTHTSVSLQDAMLLVEAMNQSTMVNVVSEPQSTEPQTQCASLVGTLEKVGKSPTSPRTHSDQTQLTSKSVDITPQSTVTTSNSEVQTRITILKPDQQKMLNPLSSAQLVKSSAAVQTTRQPLPGPLVTVGVPNKSPRAIIIVPKPGQSLRFHNLARLPLSHSPKVDSAAKHNNLLPVPRASESPAGTSSLYSVPQKTFKITYNKLLPVIPLQTSTISTHVHSEVTPQQTAITPRQVETKIVRKPGLIIFRAKHDTTEHTAPALSESSTQLISTSQESSPSNLDETVLSEKTSDTTEDQDSSKSASLEEDSSKSASLEESPANDLIVCGTINPPACSDSETSSGQKLASTTQDLPPAADPKHCPLVRLKRLPFPVSTQESILVTRLFPERFSEGITQKPSKSEVSVSGTPVVTPIKTSHVSDEPESPATLEDAPASTDVHPSMSLTVSESEPEPEPEIPDEVVDIMDPSPLPSTSDEATSDLSPVFRNKMQESQSSGRLQLTPISPKLKDPSYPQLQMTKTQFLAQLSVSPVVHEKETSAHSSADSRETRTSDKKGPQKVSIVTRLRSHLKNHLKPRTPGPKAGAEMKSNSKSPKKPRLEKDCLNDKNITNAVCNRKPYETDGIASIAQVNTISLNSPEGSSRCEDMVTTTTSVGQSDSVSCRSESPSGSAAESLEKPSSSRDGVDPNSIESTSVSERRSTSTEVSENPEMTKSVSISPRRCASRKDDASLRNKRSRSVSPQRPSPMKKSAGSKNTSSPKTTKSTSTSPNRPTREGAIPKKSESPLCLRTSTLTRSGTSPTVPGSSSSTFKKGSPSNRSIKRESSSFSPEKCSISTVSGIRNKTKSETVSPSIRGHKMTSNGSLERSEDSTPTKEPRLAEGRATTRASCSVVNAMKSTKAAKAKKGKMKMSNKSKRQRRNLGENQANNGVVKKCRAKVWYPPTLPPNEVPSTEIKKPPPVVVEDKIPLIPFNQTPIVSPLQPLAVIGKHLLRNQCGQCGRVFSSTAALESHVSLHAGYRLFSCSLCGKCFPDSKTFKRHNRVHRNGRIHICRHCGKGFVYRYGLSKHMQMVHTRIKPFICQICNKGFFTKRDVEVHIRMHTGEKPFQCHLCDKKFLRRVELNMHLRWHNGEKRHWCPYCGKGFLDLNNLKRHKYTHTGEKPYPCPRCPKRFSQTAHLKKHLRNVHKEN